VLTEIGESEVIPEATIAYKALSDGLTVLLGYVQEIKDAQKRGEFMGLIGELKYALGESKLIQADLREEVNSLRKEIEALRQPEVELIKKDGFYYDTRDKTIPLCPNCYISSKTLRILSTLTFNMAGISYECPECNWKGFKNHED
jgi:hypothetical protein